MCVSVEVGVGVNEGVGVLMCVDVKGRWVGQGAI